ncbi:general transcription factor IIH subunit 3-like isoform X2 [Drosophila virilis]|uniref:general transcription factor IIH subunit 3-like isoform X2 n=1 Tax=Drosophila virilis TaxID=7244 RepID=UPI0013961AE9|nr:general transcription factor IIH subunit 3-like isoform X2 [Drosophila virilis]
MHVFYAADKIGMLIDVCAFGFYFDTSAFEGLCMNVLCQFLASTQRVYHLNYPKQSPMDLRALCYCHNKRIEIGRACSNCLSGLRALR